MNRLALPRARWGASFLLLSLMALAAAGAAEKRKPNVLILLADDLGVMDLGCYNAKTFYETPRLDRLAQQGVRFTDGYAANPVCSPTRYSIMTGKYPTRAGLTNWLPGLREERFAPAPLTRALPKAEVTLAEALRPAGYRTAFVGKWHLGENEDDWPEARGFEVNLAGWRLGQPGSYFSPYKNPRLKDGPVGELLTDRLAEETVKLLENYQKSGEPFLLCHWFYAVHTPLQAPAELVAKYEAKAARLGLKTELGDEEQVYVSDPKPRRVRLTQTHAKYAAMVETMDTAAGKILDALDRLGLAENTLVFFTSDNGGLSTTEGMPTANVPYRAGKGWVYEGGIREPWLVRWPGVTQAGATIAVPVVSMDIYATALAAAGVAPAKAQIVDGRDLAALLAGGAAPARDALFWHYPHYGTQGGFPGGAVRMGDWKLIERYEDGRVHLYNLRDDVGEKRDRAAEQPARVTEMRARLHAWYRETGAKFLEPKESGGAMPWRPGDTAR